MVIKSGLVAAVIPCKIKTFKNFIDISGIACNIIEVLISTEEDEIESRQILCIGYSVGIMLHKSFITAFRKKFSIIEVLLVACMPV